MQKKCETARETFRKKKKKKKRKDEMMKDYGLLRHGKRTRKWVRRNKVKSCKLSEIKKRISSFLGPVPSFLEANWVERGDETHIRRGHFYTANPNLPQVNVKNVVVVVCYNWMNKSSRPVTNLEIKKTKTKKQPKTDHLLQHKRKKE